MLQKQIYISAIFTLFLFVACTKKEKQIFFIGTYTEKLGHVDGKAEGIYTCSLDDATGKIEIIHTAKGIANPSFVAVSPDKKFLYAVAENGGKPEQPFGSVVAYQIQADYSLLKINEIASYGVAPCHISIDTKQRFVFVANYGTGNVVSYKILTNGALSDSIATQQHYGNLDNSGKGKAWAHQVVPLGQDNLLAVDKGADRVYSYKIESSGVLTELAQTAVANGGGSRHLATSDEKTYVINENNSTIEVFDKKKSDNSIGGNIQTISTLPKEFAGKNACADIHIHPNGLFLYGSNRGHNSIVIYKILKNGTLEFVGHESTRGEIPRNFFITPSGKKMLVANQNSSNITVFDIDAVSGQLKFQAISTIPTPVCIQGL
jgi:6-phosphogluconolactonase